MHPQNDRPNEQTTNRPQFETCLVTSVTWLVQKFSATGLKAYQHVHRCPPSHSIPSQFNLLNTHNLSVEYFRSTKCIHLLARTWVQLVPIKILAMIYQIKCCHTPEDSNFYFNVSIPSIFTFPSGLLYTSQPKFCTHLFFPNTCYMYHPSHPL